MKLNNQNQDYPPRHPKNGSRTFFPNDRLPENDNFWAGDVIVYSDGTAWELQADGETWVQTRQATVGVA